MQIITLNLNGIRAAAKKGFFPWLAQQTADVVCVQELKAQLPDLSAEMRAPDDYHGYFHCAEQKGYSGVGIYTRKKPDRIVEGIGVADIDAEGRFLQADFGNLSIVSLYLPSGSSGEHRQAAKFYFLEQFYPVLQNLMASGRELILCGDWNIAHKEIDLKNWRSNQKNSGFLPEERAWLTNVFDEIGRASRAAASGAAEYSALLALSTSNLAAAPSNALRRSASPPAADAIRSARWSPGRASRSSTLPTLA